MDEEKSLTIEMVEYDYLKDEDYLNNKNHRLEVDNLLIGTLSLDGLYSIEENFLKELIKVNKIVDEVFAGKWILNSKNIVPDLSLKFSLTIKKEADSAIATLSVLENFKNEFDVVLTKSTIVARYKDYDNAYFWGKVKKIFNIYEKDESEGKDVMDENLCPYLCGKLKVLLSQKKLFAAESDKCDEQFVKEMLETLAKCGKYGEFTLAKFKKMVFAKGENFNTLTTGYYKELAKMLNACLSDAGSAKLTLEQRALIKTVLVKYHDTTKVAETEIIVPPKVVIKDSGKPSESSSGGGSSKGGKSGGAKSSGGSSSKGADKKADKKMTKSKLPPATDIMLNKNKNVLIKPATRIENKFSVKKPDFNINVELALNAQVESANSIFKKMCDFENELTSAIVLRTNSNSKNNMGIDKE